MTWITIPYNSPPSDDIIEKIKQETELHRWCWSHFPDGEWLIRTTAVEFKREEDAMLFALRWL